MSVQPSNRVNKSLLLELKIIIWYLKN